MIRAQGFV